MKQPSVCQMLLYIQGRSDHVVEIMKAAVKFNVVIIPYGGTSVSGALECPKMKNV